MRLRHSVLRMISASYLRLSIWNRHAADPLIYLGLCRCKFALRVPQQRKGSAELENGILSSLQDHHTLISLRADEKTEQRG